MNIYYVYEYLREDDTPYYVGKGKNGRWRQKHSIAVPPKERVRFVAKDLTEKEAFDLEKQLILEHGRKDLGTGPLRNMTTGGEGATPSPELRKAQSEWMKEYRKTVDPWNKGKKGWKCSPEGFENRSRSKAGENHPYYGKKRTDEERANISKGIKDSWQREVLTCPHCGKRGTQNMTRWHFDNCKVRTINSSNE